ncbi:MAG: BglII/BstYI family type II restriction endonuclease [Burkholderiaceae bacterium]
MGTRKKDPISSLARRGFDVQYLSHAKSILVGEFARQLEELANVLEVLSLPITEIIGSGGGETRFTQRTRKALAGLQWRKHNFVISKKVDGVEREATSHEVDHVRKVASIGTIGCEIEWNNKDPFFDRDLENFKRLHAEGAISVGIIITRGATLQAALRHLVRRFAKERKITDFESLAAVGVIPTPKQIRNIKLRTERQRDPVNFADAWTENFVSNKFGAATTHWEKLQARISRGVGNPCPLLNIGLPASIVVFDDARVEQLDEGVDSATDSQH